MKKKLLLCTGLMLAGLQPQVGAMFKMYTSTAEPEFKLKTSRFEKWPVIGKFLTQRYQRQYKQEVQNFQNRLRKEISNIYYGLEDAALYKKYPPTLGGALIFAPESLEAIRNNHLIALIERLVLIPSKEEIQKIKEENFRRCLNRATALGEKNKFCIKAYEEIYEDLGKLVRETRKKAYKNGDI